MVDEARPRQTELGLVPESGGWYVVNARETRWVGTDDMWRGAWIEPEEEWPALGFRLTVLDPGKPMARYHGESDQEEFLIVEGEATLLIEGEERPLKKWDFVHCEPWTEHVLVGAGDGPCVVVAVSTRGPSSKAKYVASEVARRYGASPEQDTENPAEAYRGTGEPKLLRYRDGDLP